MSFGQVGIDRHIQPWGSAFYSAQNKMLHGIEADRATFQGVLDPSFNVYDLEALQQPQNLNELTLAFLAHSSFEQAAQCGEGLWQFPIGQRGRLIQSIGLLFDRLFP